MSSASAARGRAAYNKQAQAASENKGSGYAHILILGPGESVTGRFRGLINQPKFMYKKEALLSFTEEQADNLALELGMYNVFANINDFAERVLQRYTQLEPFNIQQHYISRNKGPEAYMTCGQAYGDEPVIWDPPVPCVGCHVKDAGDKGVGRRPVVNFSFVPQRKSHRIKSNVTGKKDKWEACTMDESGFCSYCNANNEAKWDGMKYFGLAQTHAAGVFACADRVSRRCAVCGINFVKNVGWCCANPECEEPVPQGHWDALSKAAASGEVAMVRCKECKHHGPAAEILICPKGKCAKPRRLQLHDVNVTVQRLGEGKSTTYQCTEQLPAEPLVEDLMKLWLPKYEVKLRPPHPDKQTRQLGLHVNPFTDKPAGPPEGETESYEDADNGEEETNVEPFGA